MKQPHIRSWVFSRTSLLVFVLALGPVCTLHAQTGTEPDVDIPFTKFILDNGLTLIVHEDHKAPIVAVNVWYHVGSKNERPGKTGFAHLFEHLMFNGSENYDDDYFKSFDRVGGTGMNGTTNSDRTNYFQVVPTSALDVALWMESDRMGHLLGAIDEVKLDEQRGVVQNEKRQGENQPYGVTRQLITQNTYPVGHPYSWTTIGSMEDLDAASLDDVRDWFRTYYGAANAVLVIAGDIDAATAKQKVEKYFGDIPAGPPVARDQSWVAKRSGTHRGLVHDRVPQARIYMIWNIPGWNTEDAKYLDLVSDVLAVGKTSRLYKRLVYDDQIATNASAYVGLSEIGGLFYLDAMVQPGEDAAAVEAALTEELERFLRDGPSEAELERVKTNYRANFIRQTERVGGLAESLMRSPKARSTPGAPISTSSSWSGSTKRPSRICETLPVRGCRTECICSRCSRTTEVRRPPPRLTVQRAYPRPVTRRWRVSLRCRGRPSPTG